MDKDKITELLHLLVDFRLNSQVPSSMELEPNKQWVISEDEGAALNKLIAAVEDCVSLPVTKDFINK